MMQAGEDPGRPPTQFFSLFNLTCTTAEDNLKSRQRRHDAARRDSHKHHRLKSYHYQDYETSVQLSWMNVPNTRCQSRLRISNDLNFAQQALVTETLTSSNFESLPDLGLSKFLDRFRRSSW